MVARRRLEKNLEAIEAIKGDIHRASSFQTSSRQHNGTSLSYKKPKTPSDDPFYASQGLWNDIKDFRWIRVPSSSFKLSMIPILLYAFTKLSYPNLPNPFESLLFISYKIPNSSPDDPRYAKGPLDIAFVLYHIIVFSFVRQFTLFRILHPLANLLGIKKVAKVERFGEQAYAVLYYGIMGFWGVLIMRELPTWWYRTEYYWIDYPHWEMKQNLKRYYLMHAAYWTQQLIILGLKLEKPRSDFKELVAHHLVTIFLIVASYITNQTYIGNAVFVSMDIPDVFFAFSKICNYLDLKRTKVFTFLLFVGVWTYFRHWQSLRIIWSIWADFKLVPPSSRFLDPMRGVYMVWWAQVIMLPPVFLLQGLNLFWYYLILRILYRAVSGQEVTDERSEGEEEDAVQNGHSDK